MSVVVEKLSSLRRPEVARHLQRLPSEDRRLRFGTYSNDAALEQYVSRIDFAHDKASNYAAVAQKAVEDEIAPPDLSFEQQFRWLFSRPQAA